MSLHKRHTTPDTQTILVLTFSMAVCIKLYYSNAGPEDLTWVLYPTTVLVQAFSSLSFLFDPARGYVAQGAPVIIGPGCAGVNFYVIALCMVTVSYIDKTGERKLYGFIGLVLLTFVATVVVNALRIIGGLALLQAGDRIGFPVSAHLHTLQGTLFYFVFLAAYFIVLRILLENREKA